MADSFITVKVGKLPGMIKEVALNGSRTVADALAAAELEGSTEGYTIKVNSADAALETVLSNGQTVLLVKKIKGN